MFPAIVIPRASEVWAAHIKVRVTPLETFAHVQHPDTGLGAPVVGEQTQMLTGQVIIMTLEGRVGVVAGRGHGQRPTFTADCILSVSRSPWPPDAAASPGGQAAVFLIVQGTKCVLFRSAVTFVTPEDALISTRHVASGVVTGV